MLPAAAVLPESAEEIAEVMRFASAERLAVIPMGGRSGWESDAAGKI